MECYPHPTGHLTPERVHFPMSKPTITYNIVKEKLKNLIRLLDIPKFWGPLATIAFTIVYHLGSVYFGYSVFIAWLWLFLIIGTFVGGLRAGFICAIWIILYTLYAVSDDPSRAIQIMIATPIVAYLVGWQTRNIRQLHKMTDELVNGNIDKAKNALNIARELLLNWEDYTNVGRYKRVRLFEDALGNLLAGIVGFRHIRREIDEVDAWYGDPDNVERMQRKERDAKTGNAPPGR